MDEKILAIIEAYIDKFGDPLPDDFALRLKDANDPDEWARAIQKAIDDNKPFDDEGIFDE
jgi:hypothetical protein